MRTRSTRLAAALVTAALTAVPSPLFTGRAAALAPAPQTQPPANLVSPPTLPTDPFYQPPAGFASTAPGTVLRSREVSAAAFGVLPQHVQAWQVLYRTTDTDGAAEATVSTILEPLGAAPSATRPLLSYQVAEDSLGPQCAPSEALELGGSLETIASQLEVLLIDADLEQGWAVTVPDYEGPLSEDVSGRQAGYAVLDGIRATLHFTPAGLSPATTPIGLQGYSGGGYTTGWATELQRSYAPELNIRAAAEGGTLTNVAAVAKQLNGGPFSGLGIALLFGMSRSNPGLNGYLQTHLTAYGRAQALHYRTGCTAATSTAGAFQNYLGPRWLDSTDPLDAAPVSAAMSANSLGQAMPMAPLYIYHAVNDENVPISGTDSLVSKYCANGVRVTYQRDIAAEHLIAVADNVGNVISWLKARLTGSPPAPGCTSTTVLSPLLSPSNDLVLGASLTRDIAALAGVAIGAGVSF